MFCFKINEIVFVFPQMKILIHFGFNLVFFSRFFSSSLHSGGTTLHEVSIYCKPCVSRANENFFFPTMAANSISASLYSFAHSLIRSRNISEQMLGSVGSSLFLFLFFHVLYAIRLFQLQYLLLALVLLLLWLLYRMQYSIKYTAALFRCCTM